MPGRTQEGVLAAMIGALTVRVWSREEGDERQEIAQALLTLESLAESRGIDADKHAEIEWMLCRSRDPTYYRVKYAKKVEAGLTVHALGWRDEHVG